MKRTGVKCDLRKHKIEMKIIREKRYIRSTKRKKKVEKRRNKTGFKIAVRPGR
jgi:hypothetical protein